MDNLSFERDRLLTIDLEAELQRSIEAGMRIERLECPNCKQPHNDVVEWAIRPHKTHLCLFCGFLFEGNFKGVSNSLFSENHIFVRGVNNQGDIIKTEVYKGRNGVKGAIKWYINRHRNAVYIQASNKKEKAEWHHETT